MMRSLLCVGSPRDTVIDFPDSEYSAHGHGHNSRDFAPSTAAGRMRTAGRRLSLQISSKLVGRSHTDAVGGGDESGITTSTKSRRNSKRISAGGISKRIIGHPEGFRHEQHVGFAGVTGGNAEINWDLDRWREQIEASMRKTASTGHSTNPPIPTRPKGPRPDSISRARPPSSTNAFTAPASLSPAGGLSLSQPDLHSPYRPGSAPQPPRASFTSVASLPTNTGSGAGAGAGLNRSSSASGGINPPRRKPVPSHLPAMIEVSAFPTFLAGPKSAPGIIPPVTPQEQDQAQNGAQAPLPPPETDEEPKVDKGPGQDAAEVRPQKALVPLLGVPEGRVAGHEAHYVTRTTKARWDGAMSEIANALKDIDIRS